MEVLLNRTEMVPTSIWRQSQVPMNRLWPTATQWTEADQVRAIERLGCTIHQMTNVKRNVFDQLFQHHGQGLLQEVMCETASPRSSFTEKLAQIIPTAADVIYDALNITVNKPMEFQLCLSDAETGATTCSNADKDHIVSQLEREFYSVTSNEQMWLEKEFSMRLIKFEAWWQAIGRQELQNTFQQHVIKIRYPNMHLVSNILQSIRWMGPGNNFCTDISKQVYIGNLKEEYRSTNKVSFIRQMLKHNDRFTSVDNMEDTLRYQALHG